MKNHWLNERDINDRINELISAYDNRMSDEEIDELIDSYLKAEGIRTALSRTARV